MNEKKVLLPQIGFPCVFWFNVNSMPAGRDAKWKEYIVILLCLEGKRRRRADGTSSPQEIIEETFFQHSYLFFI